MSISNCKIVNLKKLTDPRGSLTVIEEFKEIPFTIKRVYYLYDVASNQSRGRHAHKELQEFLIAGSGSFDVVLDDGVKKERFHLNRPDMGLYISPMTWIELENFSGGAVCFALASDIYKDNDYIRDYEVYLKSVKKYSSGS